MSDACEVAQKWHNSPSRGGKRSSDERYGSARPFCVAFILFIPLFLSACRDSADAPYLCNPNFITIDGECDEPWYDALWQRGSGWAKDTASRLAGDLLGIDFKKELEDRLAASKVFAAARDKLRALQATELPSISVGNLMRVVQDPGSLDVLADFLRHGGPSAYELYTRAVDEGGPYLDQLRALLEDFARSNGFNEQEIAPLIVDAIARYRGDL